MSVEWIIVLVGGGAVVLVALVVLLVVSLVRARPVSGLGPSYAPDGTRPPTGKWNAMIMADTVFGAMGGAMGAVEGRFEITEGQLHFTSQGSASPTWSVPCREVSVRLGGTFSPVGMQMWMPERQLKCDVSLEHINSWVDNDFKKMRQTRYAREFAHVLCANGARSV